jgi:hypothetical protein
MRPRPDRITFCTVEYKEDSNVMDISTLEALEY